MDKLETSGPSNLFTSFQLDTSGERTILAVPILHNSLYLTPCNLTCSVAKTALLPSPWVSPDTFATSSGLQYWVLSHWFPALDSLIFHSIVSHLFSPLCHGTSLFSNVDCLLNLGLHFELSAKHLNLNSHFKVHS